MLLTAEEIEEIDGLRLKPASAASKMGDGGGDSSSDSSELETSPSSTCSPL